jgi:hypothetical protein
VMAETAPAVTGGGAAALDAAHDWLGRFVTMGEHELDLVTAWIAGTHCTDRELVMMHAAYPRLIFTGPKNSGKTFAMRRALSLCPRPDINSDITAPELARQIAEEHPTVGVDELDLIVGTGDAAKMLRNLFNSGYERGGSFRRSRKKMPVFAPVAVAGLADVLRGNPCLDTLRSRSFIVDMHGSEPGIERYRARLHDGTATELAEALASWGELHAGAVAEAWPEIPDGLVDRDEEIAEPLLAVAEVAGGSWPERVRAAIKALLLGQSGARQVETPAERLMSDIREVWTGDQVGSATLAARMTSLRGAPWRAVFPDPARAAAELSRYLAPRGITPVKIWLPDEQRSVQGYKAEQFIAAWAEIEAPSGIVRTTGPDLFENSDSPAGFQPSGLPGADAV